GTARLGSDLGRVVTSASVHHATFPRPPTGYRGRSRHLYVSSQGTLTGSRTFTRTLPLIPGALDPRAGRSSAPEKGGAQQVGGDRPRPEQAAGIPPRNPATTGKGD